MGRLVAATCFDGLSEAFFAALACLFFAVLPDFATADFADAALARLGDATFGTRPAFRADGLDDFFRVFLDIRLPFVAFRGTIIEVLRQTGIGSAVMQVTPGWIMLKTISTRHLPTRKLAAFGQRTSKKVIVAAIPAFGFRGRLMLRVPG